MSWSSEYAARLREQTEREQQENPVPDAGVEGVVPGAQTEPAVPEQPEGLGTLPTGQLEFGDIASQQADEEREARRLREQQFRDAETMGQEATRNILTGRYQEPGAVARSLLHGDTTLLTPAQITQYDEWAAALDVPAGVVRANPAAAKAEVDARAAESVPNADRLADNDAQFAPLLAQSPEAFRAVWRDMHRIRFENTFTLPELTRDVAGSRRDLRALAEAPPTTFAGKIRRAWTEGKIDTRMSNIGTQFAMRMLGTPEGGKPDEAEIERVRRQLEIMGAYRRRSAQTTKPHDLWGLVDAVNQGYRMSHLDLPAMFAGAVAGSAVPGVGTVAGGLTAAYMTSFWSETGSYISEHLNERDADGKLPDPEQIAAEAVLYGALSAGVETGSLVVGGKLMLGPLLKGLAGKYPQIGKVLAGKYGTAVARVAAGRSVGRAVAMGGARAAGESLNEGSEELIQWGTETLISQHGKRKAHEEGKNRYEQSVLDESLVSSSRLREGMDNFVAGAAAGLWIGLPVNVAGTVANVSAARSATDDAAANVRMAQSIDQNLRRGANLSSQRMETFLQVGAGMTGNVLLPADAVVQLQQEGTVDLVQAMGWTQEDVQQAADAGQNLSVPLARLHARLTPEQVETASKIWINEENQYSADDAAALGEVLDGDLQQAIDDVEEQVTSHEVFGQEVERLRGEAEAATRANAALRGALTTSADTETSVTNYAKTVDLYTLAALRFSREMNNGEVDYDAAAEILSRLHIADEAEEQQQPVEGPSVQPEAQPAETATETQQPVESAAAEETAQSADEVRNLPFWQALWGQIDPEDFKKTYGKQAYNETVKRHGRGLFGRKGNGAAVADVAERMRQAGLLAQDADLGVLLNQAAAVTNATKKQMFKVAKDAERMMRAAAEARLEEVRQRYTNPDGTKAEGWMRAPNGQATKLSERQWLQVRTPEFKAWFGDWENDPENASKMLDENGEPMVMYHNSPNSFEVFRKGTRGGKSGNGIYFSKKPLKRFGGEEYAVFLNLRNPLTKDNAPDGVLGKMGSIVTEVKTEEFDKHPEFDGAMVFPVEVTVRDPEQIKSATGNIGMFDPNDPNILRQQFSEMALEELEDELSVIDEQIDEILSSDTAGPELSDPVSLPPTLYQIQDVPEWLDLTAAWMRAHNWSQKDIDERLEAMKGQVMLQQALADKVAKLMIGADMAQRKKSKGYTASGPVRTNIDPIYRLSFDLSSQCVKRLAAARTAALAQKELGRPLTSSEQLALVALFQYEGKLAPCTYCYVESNRRRAVEAVGTARDMIASKDVLPEEWSEDRTKLAQAARDEFEEKGMTRDDIRFEYIVDESAAFSKDAITWKVDHPRIAKYLKFEADSTKQNQVKPYEQYRGQLLGEYKRDEDGNIVYNKQGKPTFYEGMSKANVEELNGYAGFRFFSTSDLQIEHYIDLVQVFWDMNLLGVKSHAYTKVEDYVRIFGKTGQKINMSCFAKEDKNGNIVADTSMGWDWEKAKQYRNDPEYKHVGVVLVATSDKILDWAMKQDWIDYVIPFHYSGLSSDIYTALGWEDFTSTQSESSFDAKPVVGVPKAQANDIARRLEAGEITAGEASVEYAKILFENESYGGKFESFFRPESLPPNKGSAASMRTAAKKKWKAMVESGKFDAADINPEYFRIRMEAKKAEDTAINPVPDRHVRMHELGTQKGITDAEGTKNYLRVCAMERLFPVFPPFMWKDRAIAQTNEERIALVRAAKQRWQAIVEGEKYGGHWEGTEKNRRWVLSEEGWNLMWEDIKDQIDPNFFKTKKDYARTDTAFEVGDPEKIDRAYAEPLLAKALNMHEEAVGQPLESIDELYPPDMGIMQKLIDMIRTAEKNHDADLEAAPGKTLAQKKEFMANKLGREAQVAAKDGRDPWASATGNKDRGLPEKRKKQREAGQAQTELYQNNAPGARGATTVTQSGHYVVRLFRGANLSTLVHETGHAMLLEFQRIINSGQASEAMLRDWNKLQNWLSQLDDEATLEAEYNKYQKSLYGGRVFGQLSDQERAQVRERAKQEWLARGLEQYLREGVAPTKETEGMFRRFAKWLTKVYRRAVALDVEITEEVREAFSHMIASEEDIEAEAQDAGIQDASADLLDALGLTGAARVALQGLIQPVKERAASALRRRRIEMILAHREEWRQRAEAEVANNPVYAASAALLNAPINLNDFREEYGKDFADALKQKLPNGIKRNGDLANAEVIAMAHGFRDAGAMAQAIIEAPGRKEQVKNLIAQYREEAEAELDPQEFLWGQEGLAEQQEKIGGVLYRLEAEGRTQNGEPLPGRKIGRARLQAIAAFMLASMNASKAILPNTYRRQAIRYMKLERAAILKKEWTAAIQYNYKARLNLAMEEQSRAARETLAKAARQARKFLKSKKADPRARFGVFAIGRRLGLFPVTQQMLDNAADKTTEDFEAFLKQMQENGYYTDDALIDERWLTDPPKAWQTHTWEELTPALDAILRTMHMERAYRAEQNELNSEEWKAYIQGLVDHIYDHTRHRQPEDRLWQRENAIVSALKKAVAWHAQTDTIAYLMDGGVENFGPVWKAILGPIRAATWRRAARMKEAGVRIKQIFSVYSKKELFQMRREKIRIGTMDRSLTKEQMIGVLLNCGNESNKARLMIGQNMTEENIREIISKLDARDCNFAQAIWDYFEEFRKEAFDLEERITGVRPHAVEATPVETPHGILRGGYYPVRYDSIKI